MWKTFFWIFLGLALVATVTAIWVCAAETQIIIDLGASGFRTLRGLMLGASGLLILLTAGAGFLSAAQKKRKALQSAQVKQLEEQARATLSYRDGRLDEAAVREMILQCFRAYNGAGTAANNAGAALFRRYLEQMDEMNTCQARLHTLLELNGASDLNQTEEMLDALEQNLFMNLRKAINWTNTVSPQEGIPAEIAQKLGQVESGNTALLKTAQELLTQLTDYINHQGDSTDAAETAGAFIDQLRLMIQIKEEK